jgi:hypothetical protein
MSVVPNLPPPRTVSATRASRDPRRRTLLAATTTTLLAGCSETTSTPAAARSGHASATDRLRATAAQDSEQLLARYDATLTAHPGLAELLNPLRAETAQHAAAFGGGDGGSGSPAPSASVSAEESAAPETGPAGTEAAVRGPAAGTSAPRTHGEAGRAAHRTTGDPETTSPPGGPSVPTSEREALVRLADAERALAGTRSDAVLQASGELARLLASVAAAGAAHVYLLSRGAR